MTASPLLPLSAHEACECMRQSRPVDVARLHRVLRIEPKQGILEAQAGTTWAAIADGLGIVFAEDIAIRRDTLWKCIARNAPGPDGRPAVEHVESLTMILPDGQLRRVDRSSNQKLFSLVVGGQGLFGVVYSVTLRLESLGQAIRDARAPQMTTLSEGTATPLHVLLPANELSAWLAAARERCARWRVPLRYVSIRRTAPESETFLRWARRPYDEATIGLPQTATIGAAVRMTQLRRELIDAAIASGGSFPIACTPEATRAQLERCYPELGEFLEEQTRIDPSGKLENAWARHQRRIWSGVTCEVRWQR